MFIPHKVLKSESYSSEYLAAHQKLSKRLFKILKTQHSTHDLNNKETLCMLLDTSNERNIKDTQQNSIEIVDWLFKKDLEERIKICSIQNKWFASFFVSLVEMYKANTKTSFLVKFNEKSEDFLQSLIKESFKITYLNNSNVDIAFSSDLYCTLTQEEEDSMSMEILKELYIVDLESLVLSRKILKSKCEFMKFFSRLSSNRFLSNRIEVYKTSLLNIGLPSWLNQSKTTVGELYMAFLDQNLQVKFLLRNDKQESYYFNSINNKVNLTEESNLSQVMFEIKKLTHFLSKENTLSIKHEALVNSEEDLSNDDMIKYTQRLISAMSSENPKKAISEFLEELKFIPLNKVENDEMKIKSRFYQCINDYYSKAHAIELINHSMENNDSKQKTLKKKIKKPTKDPKIDEVLKDIAKDFVYRLVNNAINQTSNSPNSLRKASTSTRPDHSDANATTDFANYSSSTTTHEDKLPMFMRRKNKKKKKNDNQLIRNSKKGNKNDEEGNADLQFTKRLSQRKSNFEEDRDLQKQGNIDYLL